MALYAEAGGHVAKRPRLDYVGAAGGPGNAAATPFHLAAAAAATNIGILSQRYIEQQLSRRSQEPEKPNHILLFTVLNPTYPITCEVLNTICSPIGKVLRIVIFKKNGVQAMVEFDAVETAKSAKENLHGCDIYSGCCTLKVEFAKPTKLNVYRNDGDSWDYTNPNLGNGQQLEQGSGCNGMAQVSQRPVLLKEPLMAAAAAAAAAAASARHPSMAAALANGSNGLALVQQQHQQGDVYENVAPAIAATLPGLDAATTTNLTTAAANIGRAAAASLVASHAANAASLLRGGGAGSGAGNGAGGGGAPILSTPMAGVAGVTSSTATPGAAGTFQHQGSVCMVYGLNPDKMNGNRIFNLFCLYGNVVRVKFLKTKEGCAMVQMGDSLAVERVVSHLNNTSFFDSKLQLGFSKQAFLADVQAPYQLPDGSPSFQDFMGSKNNRFMNPEMASKNRIQPPSKILHFFNTPPGLESSDIEELFAEHGSPAPKCVKLFPSKTERSSSGLVEFETLGDALEALVSCNHQPVHNPNGKFPYIMKLCFSSSRSIPTTIR